MKTLKETKNANIEDKELKALLETCNYDLNELSIAGVVGFLTGTAIGPKIMKLFCKALGINSGFLYDFLNSNVVTGMMGKLIIDNRKKLNS